MLLTLSDPSKPAHTYHSYNVPLNNIQITLNLHPVFFISNKKFGEGLNCLILAIFEAFSCLFYRDLLLNFKKAIALLRLTQI